MKWIMHNYSVLIGNLLKHLPADRAWGNWIVTEFWVKNCNSKLIYLCHFCPSHSWQISHWNEEPIIMAVSYTWEYKFFHIKDKEEITSKKHAAPRNFQLNDF